MNEKEKSIFMGENFLPKTFTVFVLLCTAITQHTLGQVTDNFADGNFTANPVWSGITANYIVNTGQLRLNAPAASTSYITVPFTLPANHNVTWEFFLRQNFAPSGSNNSRVYLMSSQSDLSASLNGYFLQFGEDGANDAIKLFRQTGVTNTQVCAGPPATISVNPVIVRVRVTRDVAGEWTITADYSGGATFVAVATGNDNTHTSSSYFGFRSTCTVTNIQNFFYDDVSIITEEAPDEAAPTLTTVEVLSATEINLEFSENLDATTANAIANFQINGNHPLSATLNEDQQTITIALDEALSNGHNFLMQISGIEDLAGNVIEPIEQSPLYFAPVASQKHELAITEFYPDPSPSVGLPPAEFVEIYNRSDHPFDLAGWQITDESSFGTLTTRILLPGEYLILCHTSDVASFDPYGAVMGLSTFPGLNNSGDTIKIINPLGQAIDSIVYNMLWYRQQEDKQSGGWTLEKINPHDFCKERDNWTPGLNAVGGTPGQPNSVLQITQDVDGPKLTGTAQKDAVTITLVFNEKLNSAIPTSSQFTVSPTLTIDTISFANGFQSIDIGFTTNLDSSAVYSITVQNISDCPGNSIQATFDSITFKLDSISPSIHELIVLNDTTIEVQFSERLAESVFEIDNFSLLNGLHPDQLIQQSSKILSLVFDAPFENGVVQTLVLTNVADNAGNQMDSTGVNFLFFEPVEPSFKDVILSELFPDPAPTMGLPEAEFIEIFNRSRHPFNLHEWQITDGTTVSVLPDKILLPNQYLILCPAVHKNTFLLFGETIGLTFFPSLNNSSDHIKLIAPSSLVIDSANYELKWYNDPDKDDGGHSLEIINPEDFCKGSNNWKASVEGIGGTPGKQNSVYSNAADQTGPKLIAVKAKEALTLSLTFDEKMSAQVPTATNVEITPLVEILSISFADEELKTLDVSLSQPLDSAVRYTIDLHGVKDCPGNEIQNAFATASIKIDTLQPQALSWSIVSQSRIDVTFSKRMSQASATVTLHYALAGGRHPQEADLVEEKTVRLTFESPFENGVDQVLSMVNVEDVFGNKMASTEISFRYFEPAPVSRKDIIITELFPDPSPVIALPEAEFIEIFNRSPNAIDLGGWTISDGGTVATIGPQIVLPGQFKILCSSNRTEFFSMYGPTIGLANFPSLNNANDTLVLKDFNGVTIDSTQYSDDYYRDDEKRDGGWTLELIDPQNICAEEGNWIAAEDSGGGTPGRTNSVNEEKPDLSGPVLLSAFPENSNALKLVFNEKLEKRLPEVESIQIMPAIPVSQIRFQDKLLRSLMVDFSEPMTEGVGYSVTVSNIFDCAGNVIDPATATMTFALPQPADQSDILINEVLFNPRSTGVDFVECYNNSNKFVNLKNWMIANVVNDTIQSKKVIAENDLLFHPRTYLVFTHDSPTLKGEYLSGKEDTFVKVSLPSMPDDEGTVVLLDDQENVIDLFQYLHEYHSIFLKEDEGVSLERIHFDQPTNVAQNWQSASEAVGFATPGYANSNSVTSLVTEENINVEPEIFSTSGQQRFTEIHYQFDRGNLVANVKIMDAQGREVRVLADNDLLGATGFLRWDGDKADGSKARIGTYMIWFEVFDEAGRVETIKKRVVLAERF